MLLELGSCRTPHAQKLLIPLKKDARRPMKIFPSDTPSQYREFNKVTSDITSCDIQKLYVKFTMISGSDI